jgi:acyl-CoA synthetase (AMP-forming)/AMP-acid ligase II
MTSQDAYAGPGDGPVPGRLAALIAERAAAMPGATYLQDARSERTVSYAELARATAALPDHLAAAGALPGDGVLLDVADRLAFVVAHLGIMAAGCLSVPVDPSAPVSDLARIAHATGPSLIITDRAGRHPQGSTPVRVLDLPALLGAARPPVDGAARRPWRASDGGVRLSTSGSTGAPKVVELSVDRLLHVGAAVAAHNELGPGERGFNALPLFHINAQVVAVLGTLIGGATLVLDDRFHRRGFWPMIATQRITWINAVPAILAILAADPVEPRPPRLRFIRSASAALPAAVRARVQDAAGVPVVESYGMTEAASQITATPLRGGSPAGSAGRPVAVELQIRDADRAATPIGVVGSVWIRGEGVIGGYVGGRDARRFDDEGWLETGDLGSLDADGFLYLAGRTDDAINRGGEIVYPREVEEILQADPRVLDAIVIGRPDDILGAVPVAHVIARPGAAADGLLADLDAACQAQLSRFKRPAAFHLVDDFPRTSTGKVRRRAVPAAP